MTQLEKVKATIRKHAIPRATVANLSGLWPTTLSGWLNGRTKLRADRAARVEATVEDIVRVIETMPMGVDLRDSKNVLRLIQAVNDARLQMGLFKDEDTANTADTQSGTEPDLQSLRVRPA